MHSFDTACGPHIIDKDGNLTTIIISNRPPLRNFDRITKSNSGLLMFSKVLRSQ